MTSLSTLVVLTEILEALFWLPSFRISMKRPPGLEPPTTRYVLGPAAPGRWVSVVLRPPDERLSIS